MESGVPYRMEPLSRVLARAHGRNLAVPQLYKSKKVKMAGVGQVTQHPLQKQISLLAEIALWLSRHAAAEHGTVFNGRVVCASIR